MKGMELSINTIVILSVACIVLLVVISFLGKNFYSSSNEFSNKDCEFYASSYCNGLSDFPVECFGLVEMNCEMDQKLENKVVNSNLETVCESRKVSEEFKKEWC